MILHRGLVLTLLVLFLGACGRVFWPTLHVGDTEHLPPSQLAKIVGVFSSRGMFAIDGKRFADLASNDVVQGRNVYLAPGSHEFTYFYAGKDMRTVLERNYRVGSATAATYEVWTGRYVQGIGRCTLTMEAGRTYERADVVNGFAARRCPGFDAGSSRSAHDSYSACPDLCSLTESERAGRLPCRRSVSPREMEVVERVVRCESSQ